MATPVFCCGGECGFVATTTTAGQHWQTSSLAVGTLSTSSPIHGAYSLRMAPSATAGSLTMVQSVLSSTTAVYRFNLHFTTLPTADTEIATDFSTNDGVLFKASDSKLYAGGLLAAALVYGATGVSVTTGITYRIDILINSAANPHLVDVQVDGTACGQASIAKAAANNARLRVGVGSLIGGSHTCEFRADDILVSATAADYPLGAGQVDCYVPVSDGTHNIAGTGDFLRTLTGTDILNATTTAYQLVDDVPLESGAGTDWINMAAPTAATQYVECIFGPAPGVSTPTDPPRAVEAILGIHQSAAGTTGNMECRLNDNGTMGTIYTATAVAGVTSIAYKRAHFADPPSAASAWVIGGGGDGDFTDLRVRFGSPATVDVAPDQYFDCIMLEAEFPPAVAAADPIGVIYASPQAVQRASLW